MHVRDLVEVTGVIAANGPQLLASRGPLSQHHLHQYWTTSKCRFERWHQALKAFDVHAGLHDDQRVVLRATLDEIITSEILTRVWAAIVAGHDRHCPPSADAPIVRNVLVSHVEARHRALALVLAAPGSLDREAVVIDRLRRRAERWTDVLIGGLLGLADVSEFAFDPDRAADFADELSHRRDQPGGRQAWRLTLTSLAGAFHRGLCPIAANPDANARIAASVLGCFPEEIFDGAGLPQSLWMVRLQAAASDAQGLIEDLLRSEAPRPHLAVRRTRRLG